MTYFCTKISFSETIKGPIDIIIDRNFFRGIIYEIYLKKTFYIFFHVQKIVLHAFIW